MHLLETSTRWFVGTTLHRCLSKRLRYWWSWTSWDYGKRIAGSRRRNRSLGANFEKLENGKLDQRFFGAHKYRRTCYSGTSRFFNFKYIVKESQYSVFQFLLSICFWLLIKMKHVLGQWLLIQLIQREISF